VIAFYLDDGEGTTMIVDEISRRRRVGTSLTLKCSLKHKQNALHLHCRRRRRVTEVLGQGTCVRERIDADLLLIFMKCRWIS
jgi:hypothetical protein